MPLCTDDSFPCIFKGRSPKIEPNPTTWNLLFLSGPDSREMWHMLQGISRLRAAWQTRQDPYTLGASKISHVANFCAGFSCRAQHHRGHILRLCVGTTVVRMKGAAMSVPTACICCTEQSSDCTSCLATSDAAFFFSCLRIYGVSKQMHQAVRLAWCAPILYSGNNQSFENNASHVRRSFFYQSILP